ncbi:monosaccharide ABC transporter substrate-binding protein (CUT2 family) [Anaerobacterium chartisolvens]|uniref:Monosaccharide ABC transporter substrate-binding protein (CUT2 family) n=1 Tax=Anaerobacterium chartisolvens TaxID=1297424 RepID=A0A369B5R7_9FIRM|nr:ABC transporter substrate-binding protein [Anaerobacterium chartisolvens]RCX16833.1 monosaccharide ABC transporter substrate-binding protein (CUT2 family) [Anaerobacterium chartisolvens]
MRKITRSFLAAILISLLFSAVACSRDKEPDAAQDTEKIQKKIVLGFSQVGAESNWRTANSESIKTAARDEGIELLFLSAQQKPENQIKDVRSLIAQQVDVIAFSPIVEYGWGTVLKEAKLAGIPVIIMDRGIDEQDKSLYVTHIGSDFAEQGRKAGRWLLEKVGDSNERVNVVEIQGTFGSTPTNGRREGFIEIIKQNPNIFVTNSKAGDFMRSKGKEVMEEFLNDKGSEIDVVYAHNDDMALGAIEAIEEYGLRPGKDIKIISIDAVKAAFDAMKAGKLNCTVECNPLQGPELMKAVKDLMAGKQLPKRIVINEGIFREETAEADFINRNY